MLVRHEGGRVDDLTGSWVLAGGVAGESRTPAIPGVVGGGATGTVSLLEASMCNIHSPFHLAPEEIPPDVESWIGR